MCAMSEGKTDAGVLGHLENQRSTCVRSERTSEALGLCTLEKKPNMKSDVTWIQEFAQFRKCSTHSNTGGALFMFTAVRGLLESWFLHLCSSTVDECTCTSLLRG